MSLAVLVTGARGLLGGVLVQALAQSGHVVTATGRQLDAPVHWRGRYLQGDLADPVAAERIVASGPYDAIVHAAARLRSARTDRSDFATDNERATRNLVQAAAQAGKLRLVFFSTISVYSGDGPFFEDSPTEADDPYGSSKRNAEAICLATDRIETVVLRLAGLHGHPRQDGVIHAMFEQARRSVPIVVNEPQTVMTLTFIDDVVSVTLQLLGAETLPRHRVFNLAVAEAVSLGELADKVKSAVGSRSEIAVPIAAKRRNRVLDIGRLRSDLGFDPVPLDEHLARFAKATLLGADGIRAHT